LKGWRKLAKDKITVREFIAPRYITRFHCLGSSCQDTCCGWWNVAVDEQHYRKLQKAMVVSDEMQDAFSRTFVRQDRGSGEEFANIRMGEDGYCRFLSEDRLCGLHRDYGSDVLPNICALYPRMISLVGQRLELTGQLSCPELARLCLLADDSLDLMDFEPSILPRAQFFQTLQSRSDNPYSWYFDDIRATLMKLLSLEDYPLSSRFYFLLFFARQTVPFFFRSAESVDEEKLGSELNAILHPGVIQDLHELFISLPKTPGSEVMEAVQRILVSRLQHDNCRPGYAKMIMNIFLSYEQELKGRMIEQSQPTIQLSLTPAEILPAYLRRRDFWEKQMGKRIERYFRNYSMNYILKEWYTGWPDLVAYVRSLFIRVAAIRFLMYGQPRLLSMMRLDTPSRTLDEEGLVQALDDAAVQACYSFSRNLGHSPELNTRIEAILDDLESSQPDSLAGILNC